MALTTLSLATEPALDLWAGRLQAAQAGAPKSLNELFRELRPWWGGLAQGVVHDREEAEEVVQEASLRLLVRLAHFDPARCRQAKNWLARLLVNCAIDHLRRRRPVLPLLELDLQDQPSEGPEERAQRREQADRLQRWLGELPPRDREALHLRFEQGLNYEQIGLHLGTSLSSAFRIVSKALDKLAQRATEAGQGRAA